MKILQLVITLLFIFLLSCSRDDSKRESIIWDIDNLKNIGGNKVTISGAPMVIDTPKGKAFQFDGVDDGIFLDTNPLTGASQFTIEIIFRPDSGGNTEQRFLHIGEVQGNRVLIETRLTEDNKWFLDTFIKCGESERTLYAENFLHPIREWYHAAFVYDGESMRHFVNGVKELEDTIDYMPMKTGQISIGCRMNKVYWFKGAIRKVRVTHRVLSPEQFMPM
ncbi:MAG TPA: LamG domain-containing protein [bacterium]